MKFDELVAILDEFLATHEISDLIEAVKYAIKHIEDNIEEG